MLYTSILQSSSIIADYSEEIGDFSIMVSTILRANRQPITFYAIPYLGHDYYFLHHENLTFTSITPANQNNEKILIYLQKLKSLFIPLYKTEKNQLTFRSITLIKQLMNEYKESVSENKFKKIDDKLDMIMKEKQEQMKSTLEKDRLLNKTKEKSDSLIINVLNIIYFIILFAISQLECITQLNERLM